MKAVYVVSLLAALGLFAAAEEPFPAADALLPQHEHAAASGPTLTLDEVERIALLNNPEIHVAARRVAVLEAHVPTAGALDDPSLMYRGWQMPLRQPVELQRGDEHVFREPDIPGIWQAGATQRHRAE